jgi:hypothetical protein
MTMGEGLGMTQNWTTLWEVLFGYPVEASFVNGIQEYLDGEFPRRGTAPGWTGEDLKGAMRRISEAARKDGKRPKPPTASEIKSGIILGWYERKQARLAGEPPPRPCGLCGGSGLVVYCPELEPPYTVNRMMDAYQLGVPCRCDAGAKVDARVPRLTDEQWRTLRQQRLAWESDEQGGPKA